MLVCGDAGCLALGLGEASPKGATVSRMENEHLVWAYADTDDGKSKVVVLGLTDAGIEFLRAGSGTDKKTLLANPPGKGFSNVTQIVIFHEKDKATLKQRFREAGVIVSEVN
jgi:hypothetical protein